MTTLIFPHNPLVSKPSFQKIDAQDFDGVQFSQGTVKDYLIASHNSSVNVDGMSFAGALCWVRKTENALSSFFVKSGTSFLDKGKGFESNQPLTLYWNGSKCNIITDGAVLKLMGSALAKVRFEGSVKVLSTTENYIEVELTKGNYSFQ